MPIPARFNQDRLVSHTGAVWRLGVCSDNFFTSDTPGQSFTVTISEVGTTLSDSLLENGIMPEAVGNPNETIIVEPDEFDQDLFTAWQGSANSRGCDTGTMYTHYARIQRASISLFFVSAYVLLFTQGPSCQYVRYFAGASSLYLDLPEGRIVTVNNSLGNGQAPEPIFSGGRGVATIQAVSP